jgi:hypothetical protein
MEEFSIVSPSGTSRSLRECYVSPAQQTDPPGRECLITRELTFLYKIEGSTHQLP